VSKRSKSSARQAQRLSRRRLTFRADTDVLDAVKAKGRGQASNYINNALRMYEKPPYVFKVPSSREEASLKPLLEDASRDIICLGARLRSIPETCGDFLRQKVTEYVTMTFITIHPDIQKGDTVYEILATQTGDLEFVERLKEDVKTSTTFFKELRELGRKHGTRVGVFGCMEVPRFGLIIRDHTTPRQKMRVNLYANHYSFTIHPFLDIFTHTEQGKLTYNSFYKYYEELLEVGRMKAIT